MQSRVKGRIELGLEEEPLILSIYSENWLLLSSRRVFFGSDEECSFAIKYFELVDCGWFVGSEVYSNPGPDGIPLKASPKLRLLTRDDAIFEALLEPGSAHNAIWNNIRLRIRLESIHGKTD